MKKIKLLLFSLSLVLLTVTSCTNDETLINVPEIQESASLQTALNHIDDLVDDNGQLIDEENPTNNLFFDFCFEFVYPITLIYNTGATVDVNSFEELIAVIIGSTEELYIVGIEFPFQVEVYNPNDNENQIITINNEEEFIALLENCNFEESCNCPDQYEPVCVEIEVNGETIVITFPNSCEAECEGFTEDQYFECEDECDCPNEGDPVCVETPAGGTIQFDNACEAECEGFTEEDFVDCENDCDCPDNYDPVCVEIEVNGEVEIIEFQNMCYLLCEGYGQGDIVDCDDEGCNCTDEYDPVCIEINGELVEFNNACEAECEGYTEEDFENCEDDCGCPDDYYPVCVELPNGEIIEFINGCTAECEGGYTDEDFVDCENGENCEISNLTVEVGDCNPVGTYALTIDFDYEDAGNQYFDVYLRNDEFFGYYLLEELPITIYNFELSGFDEDFVKVCINDNADCCQEIEWEAPDCGDLCYEFVFPISMYISGGSNVTANSNEEVDEYLEQGYDFVYPIEIIINGETIIVNQGILEGAYGPRCD